MATLDKAELESRIAAKEDELKKLTDRRKAELRKMKARVRALDRKARTRFLIQVGAMVADAAHLEPTDDQDELKGINEKVKQTFAVDSVRRIWDGQGQTDQQADRMVSSQPTFAPEPPSYEPSVDQAMGY